MGLALWRDIIGNQSLNERKNVRSVLYPQVDLSSHIITKSLNLSVFRFQPVIFPVPTLKKELDDNGTVGR